jgi:hypothetical protein
MAAIDRPAGDVAAVGAPHRENVAWTVPAAARAQMARRGKSPCCRLANPPCPSEIAGHAGAIILTGSSSGETADVFGEGLRREAKPMPG